MRPTSEDACTLDWMRLLLLLLALLLCACPVRRSGNNDDPPDEGTRAGDCADGADNDGDGFFDCDDQGCWGSPDCAGDDDDSTGDDDDATGDDDDATGDDDDATGDDDDATGDDDDATGDDDDSTAGDDDDATGDDDDSTVGDDDDSTEPPLPAGTCQPVTGVLTCGSTVQGDTSLAGVDDVIDLYPCSTNNEQGPEIAYELLTPNEEDVTLYLTAFGVWELDLFLLEETGGGCQASDCLQYGNYYIDFTALAGQTYYVVVDGFSGWAGAYELEVTCAAR